MTVTRSYWSIKIVGGQYKMKKQNASASKRTIVELEFHSIRNISCPEDTENSRRVFVSQCKIGSIRALSTDENVRNYLVDAEGKSRRAYTSVHKAIRDTLLNNPEDFSVLNSGITIVAKEMEIDEKNKVIKLSNPSIINGSQTQGVIKDCYSLDLADIHIKCEIILTEDDDLCAAISIARNFQDDVMAISIAGRKGLFNELELGIRKVYPDYQLRKSESQYPTDDIIDTEKLLQVIIALIPEELWPNYNERENPNKVYTYNLKSRCLKEFQEIYNSAKDEDDADHLKNVELYKFFLDIAPQAYELYTRWKSHQGFAKTGLRKIEREKGEIVEVPDGIIFPIIASLSVFSKKTSKGWKLNIPESLIDPELIRTAKTVYMEIAKSVPQLMGKNKACYTSLLQITRLYKKLTANQPEIYR
jgi:hypothetical protein